ncbi:MAG: hypothetical protein EXS31_03320 [Pedosphaera sp.]|nr:hypothetical protein [Pedosphaera sp.]
MDDGSTWAAWIFKLNGKLSASLRDLGTAISGIPDWTVTETDLTAGATGMQAEGELFLRFENGAFSFVSAAAGLDAIKYKMPKKYTTERKVECRIQCRPSEDPGNCQIRKNNCPKPIPPETKPDGNDTLSFASSVNRDTLADQISFEKGTLRIKFHRIIVSSLPEGFTGRHTTDERTTIQLWRGAAP